MDIKIRNGDIVFDSNFEPVIVQGIQQAAQQVKIAAGIRKNSFIYDRNMGVKVDLDAFKDRNFRKTLETVINEELVKIEGLYASVKDIRIVNEGLIVGIKVTKGLETTDTEVFING